MRQLFYGAPLSFLMTIIIFLIVSNDSVESRPASPTTVSHRKPPFNGSIFGKRSGNARTLNGLSINWPSTSLSKTSSMLNFDPIAGGIIDNNNNNNIHSASGVVENPIESLAQLIRQQEYLIREAIDQCSNYQLMNYAGE